MDKSVILLYIAALATSLRLVSSSSVLCPHDSDFFRYGLQSQCPISISPHPPLKVDGNFLDRALASQQRTDYTAVLVYASWCPFSRTMHPTFEKLSFMFPQVEHLAIEQSSALPSVFSRYGIHSFPSILIVNQTSRVRYHGPKSLSLLAQFYQKTTESADKRIFSSKRYNSSDNSKSVFNMNYFIIPSPSSRSKVIHETPPPPQPPTPPPSASPAGIDSRLVPVPIQLELPPSFCKASSLPQEEQEKKQVIKVSQVDQDTQLSQVYFKKTWENEFADMKILDSPKSPTCKSPKFMHQQTDKFQFDENLGQEITSPWTKVVDQNSLLESSEDTKEINNSNNNNNSNNIWKLSFTGIGAICSFGFAAATICIIFFGAHQRNKQYQHNQNRFQIYTDDNKRFNQAIERPTKLNEAFSAARGVPLPRAHVTYGGYYNGL